MFRRGFDENNLIEIKDIKLAGEIQLEISFAVKMQNIYKISLETNWLMTTLALI